MDADDNAVEMLLQNDALGDLSSSYSSSESNLSAIISNSGEEFFSDGSEENNQVDEDLVFPIMQVLLNGRPKTRVRNFVETALAKSDNEFRDDFRVTRPLYEFLLDQLETSGFMPEDNIGGREKKSAQLSLLMTMWFLGNPSSHRDLANLFHVSYSSVHRITRRVMEWLVSLMPQWIVWPQGGDIERISNTFMERAGIAKCVGAIDGSHIPVEKPLIEGRDYFNRKHSYSIALQAVVDCDMKFTNVYCGDPGSFHDTRVLRRSDLYHQAENNLHALFPGNTFLLGDKGYIGVGGKWIVTPFRDNGNLLEEQTDFNNRISSTRVVVEQAFGILKARFRRIKKITELRDLDFIVHVVLASCVLHNMCRSRGDNGDDFLNYDNDDEGLGDDEQGNEGMVEVEDDHRYDGQSRQIRLFEEMYPGAILPRRY